MSWQVLRNWFKKEAEGLKAPRKRGVLFLWVAVAFLAMVVFLGSQAWSQKSVVLAVDGQEIPLRTSARTVGGALAAGKVVLLDKDEVTPSADAALEDGMLVTVQRAVDVSIVVDGRQIAARTRGKTVREVLGESGIVPNPEDEVLPGLESPVAPQMEIRVARVRTETLIDEVSVDYKVKKQYTTKLPQGSTRVAQEGRAGTERRTWQIAYRDGREVNRRLAAREVVAAPVDKVIMVGSGMVVSRGGENIRYSKAIDMLASAYSHTGSNTASGVYPHYGAVAVDPSVIPMGTKLYVEGYGYATALDRGSAIRGNRIDLFFETQKEAMRWGLKRVKVYILD